MTMSESEEHKPIANPIVTIARVIESNTEMDSPTVMQLAEFINDELKLNIETCRLHGLDYLSLPLIYRWTSDWRTR